MSEIITSRRNERVVHMKKLGTDREYRQSCGEFLCDGWKLLEEALSYGAEVTCIMCAEEAADIMPAGVQAQLVTRSVIEAVSPMKTPQDVVFSCRIPTESQLSENGRYILIENIQDPGNVGTILRTAAAFNVDCVLMCGDCADAYSPKTVRATMGAIFRQKIMRTDMAKLAELKKDGLRLYGAALHKDSCDVRNVSWSGAAAVIGSEGSGLTKEMLDMCDETVVIPMQPQCESLNAAIAASIIMWEMYR